MRKIPGPAGESSLGFQTILNSRFGDRSQQYQLFMCFAYKRMCKIFDIDTDDIDAEDGITFLRIESSLESLVEKMHAVPLTCIKDLTNLNAFIVPCMLVIIAKVAYTSDSSWILNLIDPSSYIDGIDGYMTSDVASIHDGLRVVSFNYILYS